MKRPQPLVEHSVPYVVPFYDLDPLGIVWHGNYLKYFEKAREALMIKLNYGYQTMAHSDYIFPIVESHVKYIKPLVHEQAIIITAQLMEYENRLKIHYRITDQIHGHRLTEGYTTQVSVNRNSRELEFQSPPELIRGVQQCLNHSL
ncbi:acyl-CoA thioesterase [Wohlfahrtiimonas chitiniclastica]|uniref:acyl-CoA thioesterase n=1 Tax=Wohlfahrtiimonas chitiniclastica TaxID=400946 RepID=UPI000B985DE1|nr:thioesterase family protein [Wohlfahrtiimonas chitiniclastica]OYQ74830.1 4-hydroxybenzoyl-CoA thioesterase [Wohlfahrtiimonas chitiniclastica]